jgi:hypothetical protein
LNNSGKISASNDAILIQGPGGDVTLDNSGALVTSGAGGWAVWIAGGGDTVDNTGEIDGSVEVDSGATTASSLINHGTIEGEINIAGAGVTLDNYGAIDGAVTLSGGGASLLNDGTVDGNVTFSGNNNVYNGADGPVKGDVFAAGAAGTYIGGAKATTFVFSATGFGAGDTVTGGSNNDTLMLSSAGTITAYDLKEVSGIEVIDLANGTNAITLSNALVGSAHNAALRVNGGTGADTINASAASTASDNVVIDGGAGADIIDAGAAHDVFVYNAAGDSTGVNYDTISGVDFGHDSLDLGPALGTISTIDAAANGALSTASFDANLTSDLTAAKLAAHSAVLFTASAGTLSGDTFLIVDPTATAGYHAGADLAIRLVGATGTLAAGNFT